MPNLARIAIPRIWCRSASAAGTATGRGFAKRRGTSVLTMQDIEKHGAKKAAEIALDMAWEGCKAVYLSFDPASRRELDRPSLAGSCHARLCR